MKIMVKESGVIDMPLRLLIILVILVITVPLVLSIAGYYSSVSAEQEMIAQANYLRDKIVMVYSMGVNSSLKITVSFPKNTEYVKVGGPLNSDNSYFIRVKAYNSPERIILVKHGNVGIRVTSNNTTMVMWSGTYRVLITKMLCNYDLDGNGYLDDFYMNVEVVEE